MKPTAKKTSIVKKSMVKNMYMTRIPNSDLADGCRELSANAFKLMTYYYSKGDGWIFDVEVIANALNLSSKRTVKSLIKELETKGYLFQAKGKIDVFVVGKKMVVEYKS